MFSDELTILALYGLVVMVTLLAQTSGAASQLGVGYLLSSRDKSRTAEGIAGRLNRALDNSVTAMALFAPAILLLEMRGAFSPHTLTAAQVFLVARLVYLPAYAFGITGLRTLAWLAGFFATGILFILAI